MLRIWSSRAGFWGVREWGNAVGREKREMVVGVVGSEGSAMAARVVGGIMRESRRMLMSMGGGFGERSIVEARKGGSFGEFECRCTGLTAHGGIGRGAAQNRWPPKT